MPLTFRCYNALDGGDEIMDWYLDCDGETRGQFFGVIQQLETIERARDDESMFKALAKRASSKCVGLHEILIDFDRRHFRVLGYLEHDTFTMLYAFCKNTDPNYACPCDLARTRKEEVRANYGRSKPWQFPE